jgi:hypothetical protein
LVDTTHQPHTLQSEAWCYEWAGTDFIHAAKTNTDTIKCYTLTNAATHCSLQLAIVNDVCKPIIELISVAKPGRQLYFCKGGQIQMDKQLWTKGVLKANFDFTFHHPENPTQPMYWKGKIYTTINEFKSQN